MNPVFQKPSWPRLLLGPWLGLALLLGSWTGCQEQEVVPPHHVIERQRQKINAVDKLRQDQMDELDEATADQDDLDTEDSSEEDEELLRR